MKPSHDKFSFDREVSYIIGEVYLDLRTQTPLVTFIPVIPLNSNNILVENFKIRIYTNTKHKGREKIPYHTLKERVTHMRFIKTFYPNLPFEHENKNQTASQAFILFAALIIIVKGIP